MARHGRFAFVVLVSLAIASTGLCVSLSGGASYCPVVPAAGSGASSHDACCGDEPDCPASKERPTCRTCDDTVAFLLKGRTGGAKNPEPRISSVASPIPPSSRAVVAQASSLHLSRLSSSPPRYLLNVTFRN